ncbi:MAG TPA: NlpC/P60 family protein [Chitinophagaceae bacterium]|nr:C40 family peptidase [Chitinophagaceae bacterium]MCB9055967.1 C40 family peptidase [Chitinophagales bacterium]HPG10370.1 NlpC/P60 family protein [Chitinophagaceae bacterium]HRX92674.1 NlpC/P60 family protein [Chitinophagaceae bacterium]
MVRRLFPAIVFVFFLSSCSTFKSLNFTSNKQVATVEPATTESRFINDISVTPDVIPVKHEATPQKHIPVTTKKQAVKPTSYVSTYVEDVLGSRTSEIETATNTQLKYAVLLDTEVESLPDQTLLEAVDEWYGVRYRRGGNTKSGVDCSGFTVAVYAAAFGLSIPRVSREQYRTSRKISTTELQEGDLVFFNTNGRGVSHVGVYLGNNKFIHASVSRGVMVNDLFENYYLKRFVGAGRIDDKAYVAHK